MCFMANEIHVFVLEDFCFFKLSQIFLVVIYHICWLQWHLNLLPVQLFPFKVDISHLQLTIYRLRNDFKRLFAVVIQCCLMPPQWLHIGAFTMFQCFGSLVLAEFKSRLLNLVFRAESIYNAITRTSFLEVL